MKKPILFLAGLSLSASQGEAKAQQAERPNFVIVLGDDCTYSDLQLYNGPNAKTPNINALAKEGMTFNYCFQAAPMSSPTRHSLYTGTYPVHNGAYPNHTFCYDSIASFVQYFGQKGYRTALYGKQHVAPKTIFSYDYLGDYSNGKMDFNKLKNYIAGNPQKPFFMVVASHEPHSPWNAGDPSQWDPDKITLPPHLVDTKETRTAFVNYLAEIEVLDTQLGHVVQTLKETGVYHNTVILFLSEQGNSFPFAKWTCYNQGLHSALIISCPSKIKPNTISNALVEYVDILPTVLDLAGIQPKTGQLDGKSFYPVLQQKTDDHKTHTFGLQTTRGIFSGSDYYGIRTAATKQYRYIRNLTPEATFKNIVTTPKDAVWQSWKKAARQNNFAAQRVHNYQRRPPEELYHLETDPYELHNLANDPRYAHVKNELSNALDQWMRQQGDRGQETELKALERVLHSKP